MNRYDEQDLTSTKYKLLRGSEISKRRYYKHPIYVNPDLGNDKFINAQRGERLDNISHREYGTPFYWWLIANANNITDTMFIEEGGVIKIPYFYSGIDDDNFYVYAKDR